MVITGTSNAVNLTDGLDGLATGLVAIATLVFGAIAYASGRLDSISQALENYLSSASLLLVLVSDFYGSTQILQKYF